MNQLPGITREEEEKHLKTVMKIAAGKVQSAQNQIRVLAAELHEMLEDFDESDKEMQAIWNNKDARFKEVNRELLRAERAQRKPYFGRIDFTDPQIGHEEVYYIGRSVIAQDPSKPEVIDWRAPIAGVYYDHSIGEVTYKVKGEGSYRIHLSRKRTYEIEQDQLKDFYDSDVVANDDLLTKYLAKSKRNVLGEIIATIQAEQNEIIRKKPQHNVIVQGAAGSGKTTVAMHRISYILYNYELEFAPEDFYIIGSNQVLLNYITGVLPELDVYGVTQMTMEDLFMRLLYEDQNKQMQIMPVVRGITPKIKGEFSWFKDLEMFCERYEKSALPLEDVVLEKTGVTLMTSVEIRDLLRRFRHYSLPDKKTMLTEHLMARLENELTGKYYSYTPEEKKSLTRMYQIYFGKREWKGSIFELYQEFLSGQRKKGYDVHVVENEYDVYDLAALAYLYKRIKEEEVIREAAHVVIDEAQDFGMMAYCCLKYCLSKCTYTIMGDVSQNISLDYGLNDWRELQDLMLPDEFDTFELLRKSYRNTVEIANFATDILYHGTFDVYPVEPIIRHGDPVGIHEYADEKAGLTYLTSKIKEWQEEGMETIAVICEDEEEAKRVSRLLSKDIQVTTCEGDNMEFGMGVMVLPLNLTKGLEFDAVFIFNASEEKYPTEDGSAKRLYVAATRALHHLEVGHMGKLTDLIANPISEERRRQAVVEPKRPKWKPLPEQEEKTNEEIYKEQALEAEREMQLRQSHGPKRISVSDLQKNREIAKESKKPAEVQTSPIGASIQKSTAGIMQRKNAEAVREKNSSDKEEREFGTMPVEDSLCPVGHSKVDCSVKIVMPSKEYVDIFSNQGALRIIPLSSSCVRICAAKDKNFSGFPKVEKREKVSFRVKEARDTVEITLPKLMIRIPRKTGNMEFLDGKGKLLVKEREKEPRLMVAGKYYQFFAFDKKEAIFAKKEDGTPVAMGNSAKYISFGQQSAETPEIASSVGYRLQFPAGYKTLLCNVAVFGPYIMREGTECIDYIFSV